MPQAAQKRNPDTCSTPQCVMSDQTTTTGADTLHKLASVGGAFCYLREDKRPQRKEWNQRGLEIPLARAIKHLDEGDNVGLLCGKRFVVYDIDHNQAAQRAELGEAGHTWILTRPERPDRCALIYQVDGDAPYAAKWKPSGNTPHVELLSRARNDNYTQKVVAGGNYQLDTTYPLKTVTPAELEGIWYILTGTMFDGIIERVQKWEDRPAEVQAECGIIGRLKATVAPYEVFCRFGWNGAGERPEGGRIRLFKNGGLVVDAPDAPAPGKWNRYGEHTSGDCIDAWQLCTGDTFADALRNMADAYAIPYRDPATHAMDGKEHYVHDLLDAANKLVDIMDFDHRSGEYQRDILRAIIKAARQQDTLSPVATQRYVGEMAGTKKRQQVTKWREKLLGKYILLQGKRHKREQDTYSFVHEWLAESAEYAQFRDQKRPQVAAAQQDAKASFGPQIVHINPFAQPEAAQQDIFQRPGNGPRFHRSVDNARPDSGEFIPTRADRAARLAGLSDLMNALVEDDSSGKLKPLCKYGKRLFELLHENGPTTITEVATLAGCHRNTVTAIVKRATSQIERFARTNELDLLPLLEVEKRGREKLLSLPADIDDRIAAVSRHLVNEGQFRRTQLRHISERELYHRDALTHARTEDQRDEHAAALDANHEWRDRLTKGDADQVRQDAERLRLEDTMQAVQQTEPAPTAPALPVVGNGSTDSPTAPATVARITPSNLPAWVIGPEYWERYVMPSLQSSSAPTQQAAQVLTAAANGQWIPARRIMQAADTLYAGHRFMISERVVQETFAEVRP